jgi:hypothetical protein
MKFICLLMVLLFTSCGAEGLLKDATNEKEEEATQKESDTLPDYNITEYTDEELDNEELDNEELDNEESNNEEFSNSGYIEYEEGSSYAPGYSCTLINDDYGVLYCAEFYGSGWLSLDVSAMQEKKNDCENFSASDAYKVFSYSPCSTSNATDECIGLENHPGEFAFVFYGEYLDLTSVDWVSFCNNHAMSRWVNL